MSSRRSTIPTAIGAVLIACWANAALGQSSITIPTSSIAKPSDAGVRFHTNIQIKGRCMDGSPRTEWWSSFPGTLFRRPGFTGLHLRSDVGAAER